MKTRGKVLLLLLCAVALVAASAFGTIAYLTDNEAVTNTFTVGQVKLDGLDEADVKPDGTYETDKNARVKENEYHLIPGHTYIKDPIVHVNGVSETSYIFVKVLNGIAAYESTNEGYTKIADQIKANGWTELVLEGVSNVYYQEYTKGQEDKDLEVFENFRISDTANEVAGWSEIGSSSESAVNITAYAIQKAGFGTAAEAWKAAEFQ